MRKLLLASLLASFSLLGASSLTSAPAAEGEPEPTDYEQDCDELLPYSVSPLYTDRADDGAVVEVTVAVLTDGVPVDRVQRVVAKASESYAPLDIRLRAVSITPVTLPSSGKSLSGKPALSAEKAMDAAKDHFGGTRPAGADVVYLITTKDLLADDQSEGLAGLADCIGGVRYADRAFAIGELHDDLQLSIGTLQLYRRSGVKILGHEIGHLLGAHHHYANCVEGLGPEDVAEDTGPCTLMSNFIEMQGLRFSALEGAVIRGHAVDFASP
jgi:hypothetical protein